MLSLILGRFFPSTGLLQTAEELRQQDRQADAELAALKAKIDKFRARCSNLKLAQKQRPETFKDKSTVFGRVLREP